MKVSLAILLLAVLLFCQGKRLRKRAKAKWFQGQTMIDVCIYNYGYGEYIRLLDQNRPISSTACNSDEEWDILPNSDGTYCIRQHFYGKFISSNSQWDRLGSMYPLTLEAPGHCLSREKWWINFRGDDMSFKSVDFGQYLDMREYYDYAHRSTHGLKLTGNEIFFRVRYH
jgi:hypothetical protein